MDEIAVRTNETADSGFSIKNPIVIIGILFFVFGFVTWLGSVLIPYLKIACQLNNTASYLVAFAFYISYLVMAIPSAWVLKRTGFKNGMSLGLFIMALGALLFVPAAMSRTFGLFLTGLFVQGTGLAILQTASNPYVTILGPRESAAKRISFMGLCNGTAASLSPIILGSVILSDTDTVQRKLKTLTGVAKDDILNKLASKVIMPYLIMVGILLIIALVVKYSSLPEAHEEETDENSVVPASKTSIFQFPHLLLGVATLFFYVGMEVISGDTIIGYGATQGIPLSTAKFFSSLTQAFMLVGYLGGIICIPKYIAQEKALRLSTMLAIVFAVIAIVTKGYVSVLFISLLGLANSLIWPSVWPLAIEGLGRFTKIGSSLLVMAIGGGAIMPLIYGRLSEADALGPREAYWLVVPCYLFIFYYSVWGHKIRTR
jgi:glucose/galactose transporter